MAYEFMSAEWIAAAKAIGEEYAGRVPPAPVAVRVNHVITGSPGGHDIEAHFDTTSGSTTVDLGHLPDADVTITTDYATARELLVGQDPQAAMAAFMGGKIRVDGDLSKLLLLQAQRTTVDPVAAEVAERVRAITAD